MRTTGLADRSSPPRFPSRLIGNDASPSKTPAGGPPEMPRRNFFAIVMVGAVSLFCWQASHGAKPKDEMMELYGLFVDAVEQVESHYVRPVKIGRASCRERV